MGTSVHYHSRSTVNETIHLGDGSMIQCSITREVRIRASCPYHSRSQGTSSAAVVASSPPPQPQPLQPLQWCSCEIQGQSGVTIDLDPDSDSEDANSNRSGQGCGHTSLPIAHSAQDDDAVYMKNFPEHGDHAYGSGSESEIVLDCADSRVSFSDDINTATMTMALSSDRHATHHPDSQSTIHVQDEVLESVASCLIATMSPKMEKEESTETHCHPPACVSQPLPQKPMRLAPIHVQDEVPDEPMMSSTMEEGAPEETQLSPQKTLRANWSCMWTP